MSTREEETAKLFGSEPVPSVPDAPPQGQEIFVSASPPTDVAHDELRGNTLDESIWETFKRDIIRIGMNLRLVLFPFIISKDKSRSLKNWDLWGPLIFTLLLGVVLASQSNEETGRVFTVTFALLGIGAVLLTMNIILLGGTIVFFQSLCLLGYCLVPLVVAAAIISIFDANWLRWILTIIGIAWAIAASYPFVNEASPKERLVLAVYPVVLMYFCVGWMIIVM
eukprot:g2383.t1